MIQIINGVYGHYTGNCVEPKDKNSPPFELAPEQEARLVEQGIAIYVDGGRTSLPEGVAGVPEYDENTSVSDLREIGKMLGLKFKVGTTKAEMIAMLDDYFTDHSENGDGEDGNEQSGSDEPAPKFDPTQAVQ
ncbi:MAG: hypothetical protein GX488_04630 [Clostridiales bacterium]|nr:hypothetical protein [Clostridiales bacterium]